LSGELISERTVAGLASARGAWQESGGRPFKMTAAKLRLANRGNGANLKQKVGNSL